MDAPRLNPCPQTEGSMVSDPDILEDTLYCQQEVGQTLCNFPTTQVSLRMRCVAYKLPMVSQKCSCRRLWSKKLITKSSFIIYQVDGNKSGQACFASLQWMADVSYQFNGQQIPFSRPKKDGILLPAVLLSLTAAFSGQ